MTFRGRGLFPSPPSSQDVEALHIVGAATPSAVPDSSDFLLPLVSITDQGQTNSCVWQSIAQAVHVFLKYRSASEDIWLSTLFGYFNTLQSQGTIVDNGCIPRTALEVLTQLGFCNADSWPFDVSKVLTHPLPDSYTEANDQKTITHFYRLFGTGDDLVLQVKQALLKGYPVIYGSPIDAAYESYSGGGIIQVPATPWVGSHMRCLVGYTADYAIEANSWGTGWGNNGLGYIGWDLIKWPNSFDFWVFDSIPQPTG